MKNQKPLSVFILAMALAASFPVLAASNCGGEIRFAKGEGSARVEGSVAGYEVCKYTFYARKGQEMVVEMGHGDHPQATLYSPVEKPLPDGQAFILPRDGQYELRVGMTRNDARRYARAQPFSMRLAITKPKTLGSREVAAATSDLAGDYQGTLPCASCEGIETYLVLYDDATYTLTETYLGEEDPGYFSRQGEWTVQDYTVVLEAKGKEDLHLFSPDGRDLYLIGREGAGSRRPQVQTEYRLERQ